MSMISTLAATLANGRTRLLQLTGDSRGMGLVGFSLAAPMMVGAAGIGVEVGLWYVQKRDLQVAADAGAVAAAYELARGNTGKITEVATVQAARNGVSSADGATIAVNSQTTGGKASVTVRISQPYPRLFSAVFLDGSVNIAVAAQAGVEITGDACVLSLASTMNKAVNVPGGTAVDMPSCTVVANSTSASSVAMAGSASLTAASLWSAGGVDKSGGPIINLPGGIQDYMWPIADPYAGVNFTPPGTCDFSKKSSYSTGETLTPGVYCSGLSINDSAEVQMAPGVYYVADSDLRFGAQSRVRCSSCNGYDGLTFILTTKTGNPSKIGRVVVNGGADIQLSGSSDPSNPLAGILIFVDRRAPSALSHTMNGGSAMSLTGAIYAPTSHVDWAGGNGSTAPACTRLIADSITFTGGAGFDNQGCEAAGVKPIEVLGVKVNS